MEPSRTKMPSELWTNVGCEKMKVDSHCSQRSCKPKICLVNKAGHGQHKQSHREWDRNWSFGSILEEENGPDGCRQNQLNLTYDLKLAGKTRMKELAMETYAS